MAQPHSSSTVTTITDEINQRVGDLAWEELTRQLDERGHAITPAILDAEECAQLASLFEAGRFRSTIDMARYRFGDGRYRYFEHPLPELVAALRSSFYAYLAPIANRWSRLLRGENRTFPLSHEELLELCQKAGQHRPTPLILRYGEGDWNALHQDLYGDVFFPFQVLTVLSVRGHDFDGGEFVLLEQRPRAQSRAHVLNPSQGAFVIFPTAERPNRGRTGYHRIGMRHGVATVTRGERTALGIIFHDAA
ncbi:MAG TPA: 2OG-Fe(II) oxygenase [Solirubrobacteraceae bacterium]|nr:2OG-Fe(II) oxygenase [Solirubrobacteraceae bacterium]